MEKCKYCLGEKFLKNGFVRGVQLHRCNHCGKNQIIGGGAREDARKLCWLIHRHKTGLIATDGNYSYETMFPHHQKHAVTKAETCLAEAKNSSLRDMLARLNRRTKRYSKSLAMLRYSIWLWMEKEWTLSSIYT